MYREIDEKLKVMAGMTLRGVKVATTANRDMITVACNDLIMSYQEPLSQRIMGRTYTAWVYLHKNMRDLEKYARKELVPMGYNVWVGAGKLEIGTYDNPRREGVYARNN